MIRFLASVLLCALLFVLSNNVFSKDYPILEMQKSSKALNADLKNLSTHRKALGISSDGQLVYEVYGYGSALLNDLFNIFDLMVLEGEMINAYDKAKVSQNIKIKVANLKSICQLNIDLVTQTIAEIKGNAAIAESMKLRDDMTAACELVKGLM